MPLLIASRVEEVLKVELCLLRGKNLSVKTSAEGARKAETGNELR